jgi:acetyltransferase-like isoleucine patch superfamily enzyme
MVNIGGFCQIDTGTYIGMNAQIKDGLRIGKDAIIGMGAVVHHNIESDVIALGNPARPMRRNTEKRVFKS